MEEQNLGKQTVLHTKDHSNCRTQMTTQTQREKGNMTSNIQETEALPYIQRRPPCRDVLSRRPKLLNSHGVATSNPSQAKQMNKGKEQE